MSAGNEKCSKIDELLTESLSRDLSPEERCHLDDHCSSCPECASTRRAMLSVRDLLRQHRPEDDAPPAEAHAALHRRLVEKQNRSSTERPYSGWRLKLLLAGAFACVLLIAGVLVLPTPSDQGEEEVAVLRTTVDAKEPFTVRFTYTADQPLADVRVSIRLDEGVSFYTDDERIRSLKEYMWKGDFQPGANDVPFVVEVRRAGIHRIRTSAVYEGYLHRHDVELKVEEGTIAVTYLDYPRNRL